jgi:hypothetical protein
MGLRNAYKDMLDKVVSTITCVSMNHQNQLEQMTNGVMFATTGSCSSSSSVTSPSSPSPHTCGHWAGQRGCQVEPAPAPGWLELPSPLSRGSSLWRSRGGRRFAELALGWIHGGPRTRAGAAPRCIHGGAQAGSRAGAAPVIIFLLFSSHFPIVGLWLSCRAPTAALLLDSCPCPRVLSIVRTRSDHLPSVAR